MKKFMYCLLAALLIHIILTVLAFQHLAWWQAILASLLLFIVLFRLLVWVAKLLFIRFIRRSEEQALRMANPHLLENAQLILHSIVPSALPRQIAYALNNPDLTPQQRADQEAEYHQLAWHEIDVTIVPDSPTDSHQGRQWIPSYLTLIPIDARPATSSMADGLQGNKEQEGCTNTYALHDLDIYQGRDFRPLREAAENFQVEGPQRLRFTVGVPREQAVLKFAYHRATFGRLELHVPMKRALLEE